MNTYHCLRQNPRLICDSQRSIIIFMLRAYESKLIVAIGSGKQLNKANTLPYKE